jgi:HSP20 family molecular chaperone IbpA
MTGTENRHGNKAAEVFFTPRVDILENADEWTIYADMPGVKAEEVDIEFENGELRVRGRCTPTPRRYLLHGYEIGDYFRTFQVGDNVDAEKIHADLRHGVLIIHLPKSATVKPRKIDVRSE